MRAHLLLLLACAVLLCGGIIMRGSGGAAGPVLFTEDCTDISEWTNNSSGSNVWTPSGGNCLASMADTGHAEMLQGPLNGTDEFCSMQATIVHSNRARLGCVFRKDGINNHYIVYHETLDARPGIHFARSTNVHDWAEEATQNDCDPGAGVDIDVGDWMGFRLQGTSTATIIDYWDFGPTPTEDMEDPSTWGPPTTSCSNAELGFTTWIDAAGDCGPFGSTVNSNTDPGMDNFACGDTP